MKHRGQIGLYSGYLADSLIWGFSPGSEELGHWLLLHLAEQAQRGHLRTDLNRLRQEMTEWLSSLEDLEGISDRLPEQVTSNLEHLISLGEKNRLIVRLAEPDSPVSLLEKPRPPLVLSSDGRYLYFLRRRKGEDSLLEKLEARSKRMSVAENLYAQGSQGAVMAADLKMDVAAILLDKITNGLRLILLSGGPGTGKTTAIVNLLDLLSRSELKVIMAAPTGRAAARITESLKGKIRADKNLFGRTIQSLLEMTPNREPRRNANNPLVADLVIVDEVSMVDVALMNQLLDALPMNAALILAGDPNQLPSVESGALLSDLLSGAKEAENANRRGPLWEAVLSLEKVYRSDTGILDASAAVRAGDAKALRTAFEVDESLTWHEMVNPSEMAQIIASKYKKHPDFSELSVLIPLRRGYWSVSVLNDKISKIIGGKTTPFEGMPVMIIRNDASRNLWNGDRGRIVFRGSKCWASIGFEGREFPLAALPGWEPAWVQTIHKSQGSEFDEVVVILPQGTEHFLTRETLYTAITRAKKRVSMFAEFTEVESILAREVTRNSRIRDWAAAAYSGGAL